MAPPGADSFPFFAATMTTIAATSNALTTYLHANPQRVFLLDGGTGEELFRRGVPDDRTHWSATALLHQQYHVTLQAVHQSFLQAGADAITTNSYGCVPGVLGLDKSEEIASLCATAARLARHVVVDERRLRSDQPSSSSPLFVCGSLGPLVESYRADKVMDHDQGVEYYKIMVQAMVPFVECCLAETMSSVDEARQAVDAVSKALLESEIALSLSSAKLCMMVSFSLQSATAKLWSGEAPCEAADRLVDYCNDKQVQLVGILFNCATPEAITQALTEIHDDTILRDKLAARRIRLGAYANKLTPVPDDWSMAESDAAQPFRNDLYPLQYYEKFVKHWVEDLGVGIVGGCCGMMPEHIALLSQKLHIKYLYS